MSTIDSHLIHHARLDAMSAVLAYVVGLFILVFAIQSRSPVMMASLTPIAALVMMGASALALELVKVSPKVTD